MKKIIIPFILFLSGCVFMSDGRLQEVKNFPIVPESEKVSISISWDESLDDMFLKTERGIEDKNKYKKNLQEKFEQSKLFKSVSVDNVSSDYIVTIKKHRKTIDMTKPFARPSCNFSFVPSILSFMILPGFCEYPVSDSKIIEVTKVSNHKKQFFIDEYGFVVGMGLMTWLVAPFNSDNISKIFNAGELTADNYALNTYQMIKSMEMK